MGLIYPLRLELIGEPTKQAIESFDRMLGAKSRCPRPWVAKILGTDPRFRLRRDFLVPDQRDYSEANSVGSRGVYSVYFLEEGTYEVNEKISWRRWDRYFLWVHDGEADRIIEEEIWLTVDT